MRSASYWPGFEKLNASKAKAAAQRDARIAVTALQILGDSCSAPQRLVAEARIADPDASWEQIAASLGITKDAARSRFVHMLARKALRDVRFSADGSVIAGTAAPAV
jgi:DNA-binding transcriptional regulator WhiA